MDVNISRECISILRLESTQPENARNDWVAARRIRRNDLTGAAPIFKYRTRRRIVADFFGYLQLPNGVKLLPRQSPNPNFDVETG